jgi:preprotein translocase subunit SecG
MLLSIALIIICSLLILVVLMQNSKGGGISSQFGAATQIMGVRRGADVIEKATWTLAILLLVFSLLSTPKMGVASDAGNPTKSMTKEKAATAVPLNQGGGMQQQPQQQPQGQPAGGEQHGPGDGHNH